ncbi:hypothetical protein HY933_01710 [Candidatus Falkowbacteria bacterium]|nr:hypothetical protein [Candidatus Falkowbacteria bacterium]
MVIPAFLVVLGLAFLARNLGWLSVDIWSVVWPVLIILLGLSLLSKKGRWNCWWCGCDHKSEGK